MTVQCARCHDHKYDPISTKDYYSLYGLFAAARMPVEGTGMLAELPEIGPRPVECRRPRKRSATLQARHRQVPAQTGCTRCAMNSARPKNWRKYLLAAQSVADKKRQRGARARQNSGAQRTHAPPLGALLAAHEPKSASGLRSLACLRGFARSGVRGEGGGLAEQEKANKANNRHVVGDPHAGAGLAR